MTETRKAGYGQYCPLSMAAEFLCTRWTLLILREMTFGAQTFNHISRGVPRMSRTLLSKRLKELIAIGLVSNERSNKDQSAYQLTPAGKALRPVIFSIADWSQEWLRSEPSLENVDADLLLWNIRRHAKAHPSLPRSFVVHFSLSDQPTKRRDSWLLFENDQVDLCIIDRNFDVDVEIACTAAVLTSIWMGWSNLDEEVKTGRLSLNGPRKYTCLAEHWLGHSRLASIEKQPPKLQIN
ncbi:MAG: winged helix-turn-helix transcriptional regulator [Lysobacterales bacterium]